MTDSEFLQRHAPKERVPAFKVAECSLCVGPYESAVIPRLLQQQPITRAAFETALLIRFAGFCEACAQKAVEAGKTMTLQMDM